MGNNSSPQNNPNFGNGEVGGDKNWTPPVHATTADGRDITVSFGMGKNEGQTLAQAGHVSGKSFYGDKSAGIKPGHDHYDRHGRTGMNGDRGGWL